MNASDIIAGLALVISILSAIYTFWYGRSQHLVNKGLLEDRIRASHKTREADLRVVLTLDQKQNTIIEMRNLGDHPALNIHCDIGVTPGLADLTQFVRSESPFSLDAGATRKFPAPITWDTKLPAVVELTFFDGREDEQTMKASLYQP